MGLKDLHLGSIPLIKGLIFPKESNIIEKKVVEKTVVCLYKDDPTLKLSKTGIPLRI